MIVSWSVKWKASQVSTRPVQRTLCKALGKKLVCSLSIFITEWNVVLVHVLLIKAQVTHSQRIKRNIEENKTVKPHFSCSLSSLLGFWVVLEVIRFFFSFFFSIFFLSKKEGRLETPTIAEHKRLDSITLISGKSQSPGIRLRQGKVGTLFYHSIKVEAK